MLDGMRKASQGWLGKIVMAVVVGFISLSFVIWGVGDIFRGFGSNTVARVGKTEIPAEAVRNAYQTQLQQLQRQSRRAVTNEQARAQGLDTRVIGKLIADAALDGRARELGLSMSDAEIAKTILTDPTFAGPTGKFDSAKFNEILRDNGYSERSFAAEQRRVYLRQELVDALAGNAGVPKAALEAIHRFRNEARSVDYFELPAEAAGEIKSPDDATLQAWFDARKQGFRAPEYRGLVTLQVTPALLADAASVPDADALAAYERDKARLYTTPEKRAVEQVLFADEKTAGEASAKVIAGESLEAAAEAFKTPIVPIGEMTKAEIFDKALAEAAFGLAQGAVSAPFKGQFGYMLARAAKVTPEAVRPLAEVVEQLKRDIAAQRAKKSVADLRDKIEDERTSGKALADAAKAAGLAPVVFDAVDQSGRDKTGKEIQSLPEREALLRAAFASDVGVDNETLNTKDSGYVWFEVSGVEKARERALAEVKDQAAAAWRDDEISRLLSAKALGIVKRIDGGEAMEDIAKAEGGLELRHDGNVRRSDPGSLPAGAAARVFSVVTGRAGSAEAANQSRIVFKVLDAVTPVMDADSETNKSVEAQLRTSIGEDILVQYLAKLQLDQGVVINDAAARAATGGSAEPN